MRFVFRGPATRVLLLGETSDWRNPIALERDADDAFAAEIDLPTGVYQYKLLVDGAWTLDPDNARTRSEGGHRNNVVAIGGAPEPLLFAPAPPWVEELDRGGVRVLVGVRKTAAATVGPPRLSYSEDGGATFTTIPLERAFEEDEHVLFTATLPTSAAELLFRLADFEATWTRTPAADRAPAWLRDATIYTVFVDRFRPAEDREGWEVDPGKRKPAHGHLDGIRRSLDELRDLGVDTLYLTPVHVGASVHRYDVVDPLTVDPDLGGEAAYDALVAAAKARGMRILQDLSFAHAGRGFPPYEDVIAHGASSRYAAWFQWNDGALVHYGKRTDAPLFDLANAEVQDLVLRAVAYWAKRGASGLRLDMTAEVPIDLGRRMRRRFRELVPDGAVVGEVVPRHAWRWRAARVVDVATDFGFHEAITRLVTDPRASAAEVFAEVARVDLQRGGDPRRDAVRFLSTHDHPRLATLAAHAGLLDRLPAAYALLLAMPGIPMLLYGEEVGLRSDGAGLELEDVWPDRAPMPWVPGHRDARMQHVVRSLLAARASSPALRSGSLALLFADASTVVFRREAEGDVVDVAIALDDETRTIELDDDERPVARPLVLLGGASADGAAVTLPGHGVAILRRERAVPISRARRNLALRDREMAAARTTVESRPSRFFFSVTERCNLRCAHCITHAPERTAEGTARTMTPAVLDALRADLGLGDYFAFVHGGESLTSPILFDVLEAIRSARGTEPFVAHLLTNGLLLAPSVARRLVASGISSLSVSLDGATAVTNDAIRVGGRFDDVVRNLGDVLAWRKADAVDLRVGLSYVVLAPNVGELDAFVDLGARLGVDWIKLEEGVPATPFAKRSLVSCAAPEVRSAIDAALARGRDRGIVMVDHTFDRPIWRCRLDDATRAFLEGDEFANRSPIHPCRTPWETACVEPNGDVRALDFFGPILGNVTQAPLSTLWNGREAALAREQAGISRLCGPSGPVTCLG